MLSQPENRRVRVAGAVAAHGPRQERSLLSLHGLSPAELAALRSAALGESVEEASRRLHKSPWTIRSQRNQAIAKLGARNIAQAVYIAAKGRVI